MNYYWPQEKYIKACRFAAEAHKGQLVPGTDLPYLGHLAKAYVVDSAGVASDSSSMALPMSKESSSSSTSTGEESSRDLTIISADGISEVVQRNRSKISLSSADRVERYVSASDKVITSICSLPPNSAFRTQEDGGSDRKSSTASAQSSQERIAKYRTEALLIHDELTEANEMLANRLYAKAEAYNTFMQ